jgi:hypothetical protein
MATFTRFAPGGLATEVAAANADAIKISDALARGYPASVSHIGFAKVREFENTFTPAAILSGPAARPVTTLAAGDFVKMFSIPDNHVFLAARLEVVTAGTTALAAFQLHDGAGLGTALLTTAVGQQAYVTTKMYINAAGTDISLLVSGASVVDGLYRLVVLAMDMTGQETTTLITG